MNLTQYAVLLKALEAGTLSAAAESMGYTQSGLTKTLNMLESEIGFRLLVRDRHGVHITAEGSALLPLVQTLMNDQSRIEQYISEVQQIKKGLVTIGTFNSVSAQWLPGMIKGFTVRHPGIRFELLHGTNDQIVNWLRSSRLDLGFTRFGSAPDLEDTFLMSDPIVGVFSDQDPHASQKSISLAELTALPYIALNEGVDDEITEVLAKNAIELHPSFVESDDHAVLAMVEQGLGVSLMSQMMVQGFDRKIKTLPLDPGHERQLGIACRDRRLLSPASAQFLDYAVEWVKEYRRGKKKNSLEQA